MTEWQETGEPRWPFTGAGLKFWTAAPASLYPPFQMQSPSISKVCLSPQRAAFSVHLWKWSHRTPANSLNTQGACHFCLPHLSLLSILGTAACHVITHNQLRKAPLLQARTSHKIKAEEGKEFPLSRPFEEACLIPLLSGCSFGHFLSPFCFPYFLQKLSIGFWTYPYRLKCL